MRKILTVAVLVALLSAFTVARPTTASKEPVKAGFQYDAKGVAMFDGKVIVEGVTINPKTGAAFAKHTFRQCGFATRLQASWAMMTVLIPADAYGFQADTFYQPACADCADEACYFIQYYT